MSVESVPMSMGIKQAKRVRGEKNREKKINSVAVHPNSEQKSHHGRALFMPPVPAVASWMHLPRCLSRANKNPLLLFLSCSFLILHYFMQYNVTARDRMKLYTEDLKRWVKLWPTTAVPAGRIVDATPAVKAEDDNKKSPRCIRKYNAQSTPPPWASA